MRFLVDECAGPSVARWLREIGHDVISVFEESRGAEDEWIIKKANAEKRIIITNDKDFGEMIFRWKMPHQGIILLRGRSLTPRKKIAMPKNVLSLPEDKIAGNFIVVTETAIRITSVAKDLN